ncbi:unnamed protein product [Ectocarpus sp. 8 AP-2014]
MRPQVAPQPKSEGARVELAKPKPSQRTRRGRPAGCTEERLSRRPVARSKRGLDEVLTVRHRLVSVMQGTQKKQLLFPTR